MDLQRFERILNIIVRLYCRTPIPSQAPSSPHEPEDQNSLGVCLSGSFVVARAATRHANPKSGKLRCTWAQAAFSDLGV